jgi:hypothetical protein
MGRLITILILISNPHENHLKSTKGRGQGFAARGTKFILVHGGNNFQKPPLHHHISELQFVMTEITFYLVSRQHAVHFGSLKNIA